MTIDRWWQVVSLLSFAALGVAAAFGLRRENIRAASMALLTIAINNALYYFYILWLREALGIPHSNTLVRAWGAVRNLHLVMMALGAIAIYEYARWKSG